MTDSTNTPSTFDFDHASWQDLNAEAKRLQSQLALTTQALANRDQQYNNVRKIVKDLIEDEVIRDETILTDLVRIFDLTIMREVEFTITVEITGTVEIPLGSELDEYSFSVGDVCYDNTEVEVVDDTIRIESWNFSE